MKGSAFVKLKSEANSAYVDIYDTYGVSFVKGSFLALAKKSASKGYVTNDSRLSDGVQIVAGSSDGKYAAKSLSLSILLETSKTGTRAQKLSAYYSRVASFTDKISQGLFYLKIPTLGKVFKLVYNDMEIKQEYNGFYATFTLKLTEPNPADRDAISNS